MIHNKIIIITHEDDENQKFSNEYNGISYNSKSSTKSNEKDQDKDDQEKFYTKVGETYHCGFNSCNKQFNTQKKIKKHIKSHIFKKKIVCFYEGCNKRFTSKNNLKVNLNI